MTEHHDGWGNQGPPAEYPASDFPPPLPGYPGYPSPGLGAPYPPPQYPVGAPGYPLAYPGAPMPMGYPQPPKTNGLAIASLVCSLLGLFCCVTALPGVILGHMATSQIKQTGEEGKGLALAGLIIGYVSMAIVVIFFALMLIFPALAMMAGLSDSSTPTATYSG